MNSMRVMKKLPKEFDSRAVFSTSHNEEFWLETAKCAVEMPTLKILESAPSQPVKSSKLAVL
jgi:hypothetical protein